ncbi:MAG: hypothetical protein GXP50_09230 [Deltaproteobacteria bacterium]|nr:hypothetical protein [Deltaproteobacteria bacterium]
MERRCFEDLTDGERLWCRDVPFTEGEIIGFARRYDPQPFHIDPVVAERSIFGGIIASSLHTLSACTRVVVEAVGDVAILSGVGLHEAKMHAPVRPGDILAVRAWWCDLRRSRSRPGRGLASIRCEVANQRGQTVITYGYRYMVACRNATGSG